MSTSMLGLAAEAVGDLLNRRVIGRDVLSTGDAVVARFHLDGHEPVIVKAYRDRHAYRAARELHVHKLVHAAGDLEVARLLAVSASPPMLVFADQGLQELAGTQRNPMVLGGVLRRFHGVRSHRVLPPVGAARFRPVSEQIRLLIEVAGDEGAVPVPTVLHRLSDMASEAPLVLCHGDLHPSNVLVTPEQRLVVIDFELTTLGPAEFDLARTAVLCDWLTVDGLHALMDGYSDRVSFDLLAAMTVFHVLAGWRDTRHDEREAGRWRRRLAAARSLASVSLEGV